MTRRRVALEKSSGNVFADLGFDRPDEVLTKAQLILEIVELIRARRLTQTAAGLLLGVPQPKVSLLFHGKVTGFSTDRLLRLLTRLGQDVDIVVRAKPTARHSARVRVVGRGLAAAR